MKALMSNTLRDIISDPKKNDELKKGILKLHGETKNQTRATVSIGNQKYEVSFAHRKLRNDL